MPKTPAYVVKEELPAYNISSVNIVTAMGRHENESPPVPTPYAPIPQPN